MSVEQTRRVVERYLNPPAEGDAHADMDALAEDVVFTVMSTGEEHKGREAIGQMLDYFYHGAFEADVETRAVTYGEKRAVGEWDFVGKHIGEFAGVPATDKDVRVPLCVVYDVEDDQIQSGRIYFEVPVFLAQVGAL